MEVDVAPGELADDERTETERSPADKAAVLPVAAADDAEDGDNANDDDDHSRRGSINGKKHRRGKTKGGKRHWKPYNKLSWEERQALDERESRRAHRKRQERFAKGQPMAPYNTTQFLMEQHQPDDGELNIEERKPKDGSGSLDSSEEYYDSPEDDELFMAKDFSETYNNVHAERLQNMTKEELVRELLELESRVEKLERKEESTDVITDAPSKDATVTSSDPKSAKIDCRLPSEDSIDIRNAASLEAEIHRLRSENQKLRHENAKLKAEGSRSPNA